MSKPQPNLVTISLGAGLQSSLLCEMLIAGELPLPVDAVIFADTGDEPDYVYQQVHYLKDKLKSVRVPLFIVSAGNMVDDLYGGKRFVSIPVFTVTEGPPKYKKRNNDHHMLFDLDTVDPGQPVTTAHETRVGRLRRQCTREYKIEPIEKCIRQILLTKGLAKRTTTGAIRVNRGVTVETWLGITLDEVERVKPAQTGWVNHRWPLIEKRMTRADCVQWYLDRDMKPPRKSSCKRCPYHDDPYWLHMKKNRPQDWFTVVQFDEDLRGGELRIDATSKGALYVHRSGKPLADVQLKNENQLRMDICGGYCFT